MASFTTLEYRAMEEGAASPSSPSSTEPKADAQPSMEQSPICPTSTTSSTFPVLKPPPNSSSHSSRADGSNRHTVWRSLLSCIARLSRRLSISKPREEPTRPPPFVRDLESCPKGYPRTAAFLDSDEEFSIYRRFGYVQSRLLLEKQDEMRRLETKLVEMDEADEQSRSKRTFTREFEPDRPLLKALEVKFQEYAKLLCTAAQMTALNRPGASEYTSVLNFLSDRRPLANAEREWINWKDDVVTLKPGREHAWLDSGIERLLRWTNCKFVDYLFCSKDTKRKSTDPNAVYYTRSRIERLVVCIVILMVLALLIVPIYILYHLVKDISTDRAYSICVGVILVSTLGFSAMLSLFTRARRHEIFGAAAAYCAVLVVFLGNVGTITAA